MLQEIEYADDSKGVKQFPVHKRTPRAEMPKAKTLTISNGRMAVSTNRCKHARVAECGTAAVHCIGHYLAF